MNTKLPEVTVLSKCRANLTFVYTKHVTLQTDRRTEGQTDRQICYINIARQYADAR